MSAATAIQREYIGVQPKSCGSILRDAFSWVGRVVRNLDMVEVPAGDLLKRFVIGKLIHIASTLHEPSGTSSTPSPRYKNFYGKVNLTKLAEVLPSGANYCFESFRAHAKYALTLNGNCSFLPNYSEHWNGCVEGDGKTYLYCAKGAADSVGIPTDALSTTCLKAITNVTEITSYKEQQFLESECARGFMNRTLWPSIEATINFLISPTFTEQIPAIFAMALMDSQIQANPYLSTFGKTALGSAAAAGIAAISALPVSTGIGSYFVYRLGCVTVSAIYGTKL